MSYPWVVEFLYCNMKAVPTFEQARVVSNLLGWNLFPMVQRTQKEVQLSRLQVVDLESQVITLQMLTSYR